MPAPPGSAARRRLSRQKMPQTSARCIFGDAVAFVCSIHVFVAAGRAADGRCPSKAPTGPKSGGTGGIGGIGGIGGTGGTGGTGSRCGAGKRSDRRQERRRPTRREGRDSAGDCCACACECELCAHVRVRACVRACVFTRMIKRCHRLRPPPLIMRPSPLHGSWCGPFPVCHAIPA